LTDLGAAVIVDLPLRGEWLVERTPAHRIPSHGTDLFGQRFAYDFVRVDQRRGLRVNPAGRLRWYLLGGRTRDCYAWGQPVYAAFDGEVVTAVDGVAERARIHLLSELWHALTQLLRIALTRRVDSAAVAGNHVVISGAGTYALYAHLTTGSVAVRTHRYVRTGDLIGRVGHTGNSTSPHLHFQLMDSADAVRAAGVPCAFGEYLAWRDGHWQHVERGVPERFERIRSVG
jgi:hypothetical protein